MSELEQNSFPQRFELRDALNLVKKEVLLQLNCHHVGIVQTFDASTQTATVQIAYQKTRFVQNPITEEKTPQLIPYPLLLEVPVVVLGGGLGNLTFPIITGDECLVLFNDRDFSTWYQGSITSPNASPRLHSFSDAVAIVGVRSAPRVLTDYDGDKTTLSYGTTKIALDPVLIGINNIIGKSLGTILQDLITHIQALVTQTAAITVTGVTSGSSSSGPPSNAVPITNIGLQLLQDATDLAGLLE